MWHTQEAIKDSSPPDRAISASAQGSLAFPDRFPSEQSLADSVEDQMAKLVEAAEIPRDRASERSEAAKPISAEFEDSVLSDLETPSLEILAKDRTEEEGGREPSSESQSQNAPRPGVPPRAPEHSWNSWPHRNARDLWSAGYGTLGAAIFIWRSLYFW